MGSPVQGSRVFASRQEPKGMLDEHGYGRTTKKNGRLGRKHIMTAAKALGLCMGTLYVLSGVELL